MPEPVSYTHLLPDNGDQNSFYYKISDDGNSLIVTNSQEITQAHTLIFDITYYTYNEAVNQKPSAISSGSIGKVQAMSLIHILI